MGKKYVSFIIIFTLLLSLVMPTAIFAETTVEAKIGNTEYSTLEEAVEKAVTGSEIVLVSDVTLEKKLTIKDKNITLNLNGKTVNVPEVKNSYAIVVYNDLTITGNGTMNFAGKYGIGTVKDGPSNLIIENGTFNNLNKAGDYLIGHHGKQVIIKGGTFNAGYCVVNGLTENARPDTEVIIEDGTFNCLQPFEPYTTVVLGNVEIVGGTYNQDVSYYVAEHKTLKQTKTTDKDGVNEYTVIENKGYNFKNALSAGGTVTLNENITVVDEREESRNIIDKDTTVNFGDKTFTLDVSGSSSNWVGIRINAGNVVFNGTTGGITVANTIENGARIAELYDIIVGTTTAPANLTIKGGRYIAGTSAVSVNKGTLTIEGGYFKSLCGDAKYLLNCIDNNFNDGSAKIIVKGGTFVNFNPAEYYGETVQPISIVEEGYKVVSKVVDVNTTEYSVVCAHTSLNHSVEKEPTYIENGEREHFACTNCSKLFLDEAASMEVAKADLVIPKLVQVSGSDANVKDEAVDSAIKDSNITDSSTVTIPLGSLGTTVDTVTLPVESLEKVVSENKDLTITTTEAIATIDNKALDSIVEQAGNVESIKIEIKEIEATTLNKEQKEAIKNKSVAAVISAEIIANGKTISNFGGGKIKLEIPFTPEKDAKASDYKVIYIADDGDITEIPTAYKDGKLVVELEHFSEYAIVNVAKASSSSSNSSAGAAPVKDATPKTGSVDMSLVVMSLVGTIALAGVVVIKRYSK